MIHAESLNNDKSSIVWHHMGLGGTKCLRKQLAFGPKVQYFLELNSKKKKKKKSNSRIYSERISKKKKKEFTVNRMSTLLVTHSHGAINVE